MEQTSNLRREESAIAWFYRILRNSVIDYYRHRAAEDRALERWAEDLKSEAGHDARTHEIVCECIGHVLLTLKPAYTEILRDVDLGRRQSAGLRHQSRNHAKQRRCSRSSCTSGPQKTAHPRLRRLLEARLSRLPLRRNEAILRTRPKTSLLRPPVCAGAVKR